LLAQFNLVCVSRASIRLFKNYAYSDYYSSFQLVYMYFIIYYQLVGLQCKLMQHSLPQPSGRQGPLMQFTCTIPRILNCCKVGKFLPPCVTIFTAEKFRFVSRCTSPSAIMALQCPESILHSLSSLPNMLQLSDYVQAYMREWLAVT